MVEKRDRVYLLEMSGEMKSSRPLRGGGGGGSDARRTVEKREIGEKMPCIDKVDMVELVE
jgi:hypothetical protein